MKKHVSVFILAFVISFTIFIYEPIILYANNMSDLWFDLKSMLIPMIVLFILLFGFIMFTFFIIEKLSKNNKIYYILNVLGFIVYYASYIQGNYLIGSLPKLDGEVIVWSGYKIQNIITLFIWIIISLTYIICIKKFKIKKVINVSSKLTLVIFVMLFVSMILTLFTTKNIFLEKKAVNITSRYYNEISNNQNLVIFLVDAVDSRIFEKVRNESEYKNTFDDFTYYPDTLSYYLFTRDSIPLILSGIPNHNEEDFYNYYNKAMNKSSLMNKLVNEKYKVTIYDDELLWSTDKIKNVSNVDQITNKIKIDKFLVHELKYVGYKYLPYAFKKIAKIENMNFAYTKNLKDYNSFSWNNKDNYNMIKNKKAKKIEQNVFKFIHTEGAHFPFDEDSDLNIISDGTYEQKVAASLKLINTYINWLKENNVYDNTAIVVTADHGYNDANIIGRQNPILYIKGVGEHHEFRTSNKKISSLDFSNMFIKLLEEKNTDELFDDVDKNRERKFIWYEYSKENKMIEYVQKGNAWNNDTIEKTGIKYNR